MHQHYVIPGFVGVASVQKHKIAERRVTAVGFQRSFLANHFIGGNQAIIRKETIRSRSEENELVITHTCIYFL